MDSLKLKLGLGSSNTEEDTGSPEHINQLEINIENIEQRLNDWTIPKVETSTIYSKGKFEFLTNYSIKTSEQTVVLDTKKPTLRLLTKEAIERHKKKGFKYLHIGLVQIGVKPLFRLGCDTPILVCLRDERHQDFDNSLLGLLESNLANGPIYNQCYPNYSISLFDPNVLKTLSLTVKVKGLRLDESPGICVIYRVYYKVMTTTIKPRCKVTNPIRETIQFEYNKAHGSIMVPKRLKWDEVLNSGEWELEEAIPPENPVIITDVSSITKDKDKGIVKIKFERPSIIEYPESSSSRHSISSLPTINIKGINIGKQIAEPIYQDIDKNNNDSPTKSEMSFNTSRQFY